MNNLFPSSEFLSMNFERGNVTVVWRLGRNMLCLWVMGAWYKEKKGTPTQAILASITSRLLGGNTWLMRPLSVIDQRKL